MVTDTDCAPLFPCLAPQEEEASKARLEAEKERARLEAQLAHLQQQQAALEQARAARQVVVRLDLQKQQQAKQLQLQVRKDRVADGLERGCLVRLECASRSTGWRTRAETGG